MYLNIEIDLIILKTDDQQFTLTTKARRPASADRTVHRQFQAVFPVITGSFPTNVIVHLHDLSTDLTVGRYEQSVQLLIRQLVEMLDWQSNCVNIGLTVDPTIDPTVQVTGQPVSRTQGNDASGRLPRYEAKCVQRTRFQWGVGPFK